MFAVHKYLRFENRACVDLTLKRKYRIDPRDAERQEAKRGTAHFAMKCSQMPSFAATDLQGYNQGERNGQTIP